MRRKPDMEDRIFSKLGLIILILILCTCQLSADAISIENVPYIHQVLDFPKSYPYRYNTCGACCLEMAYKYYLDGQCDPEEVKEFFKDIAVNYDTSEAKTDLGKMYNKARDLKLGPEKFNNLNWDELKDALDHGCLIITSTTLTKYGHYILLVGYIEDGEKRFVIANDSAGNYNKKYFSKRDGEYVQYEFGKHSIGRWGIIIRNPDLKKEPAKIVKQQETPPEEPQDNEKVQTSTQTPGSELPWITQPSNVKRIDNTCPVISPNGEWIVFVSDRDGNNEIYIMSIDGSNQTRITSSRSNEFSPMWTKDSRCIVFTSDKYGKKNLWMKDLRDLATRKAYCITKKQKEECYNSVLLNDGSINFWRGDQVWRLVLVGVVYSIFPADGILYSDNNQLIASNFDKSNQRVLVNNSQNIVPAYKTPGRFYFISNMSGNYDIYSCHLDGSNIRSILQLPRDQKKAYILTTNSGVTYMAFDSNHESGADGGFDIYLTILGTNKYLRLTHGNN